MNAHTRQRMTWWVLVIITVASFTTALFLRRSFSSPEFVIISFAIYAIVGALVSWRRPENPIGWVFLWIGVLTGLAGLSGAGTQVALAEGPPIAWWGRASCVVRHLVLESAVHVGDRRDVLALPLGACRPLVGAPFCG